MACKNIIFIVGDDVGREQFALYGINGTLPGTPNMPRVTALAAAGVVFRKAYVSPYCSPTRACHLTGRIAARTGIGRIIDGEGAQPLLNGEFTLPELLKEMNPAIRTGAFGKWHLGNSQDGGIRAPVYAGWDHSLVTVRNLAPNGGTFRNVFDVNHIQWAAWYYHDYLLNGTEIVNRGQYCSTYFTDRAIDWIRDQGDNPFFCYMPYHAPHGPLHQPPAGHFNATNWPCPLPQPVDQADAPTITQYFKAALEALDIEIGRLIDSLTPSQAANTMIIFEGDNGTPGNLAANEFYTNVPPYNGAHIDANHAKETCYEEGIHVPFWVAGAGVSTPGRSVTGITGPEDLYLTIPYLLNGGNQAAMDRIDRVLLRHHLTRALDLDAINYGDSIQTNIATTPRSWVISEIFSPNGANAATVRGHRSITDSTWKLYYRETTINGDIPGIPEFYNITTDPQELTNLAPGGVLTGMTPTQRAAYNDLLTKIIAYYAARAARPG